MLDNVAVTTLLTEYQDRVVLESPSTCSPLRFSPRGTSFSICNWFRSILVGVSDVCLLRVGHCYCHAAVLCDGWLIDIAHAAWAYNLQSGETVCLLGTLSCSLDEQHPLSPVQIRWFASSYEIGTWVFDNRSCSDSLYVGASQMTTSPCFSTPRHLMRFANQSLHILNNDCYTLIENGIASHLLLDAHGVQYVIDSIFNQG